MWSLLSRNINNYTHFLRSTYSLKVSSYETVDLSRKQVNCSFMLSCFVPFYRRIYHSRLHERNTKVAPLTSWTLSLWAQLLRQNLRSRERAENVAVVHLCNRYLWILARAIMSVHKARPRYVLLAKVDGFQCDSLFNTERTFICLLIYHI